MLSEVFGEASFLTAIAAALIFGAASGAGGAFIAVRKESLEVNIVAVASFIGILASYAAFPFPAYLVSFPGAILVSLISILILKLIALTLNAGKYTVQLIVLAGLIGAAAAIFSFLSGNSFEAADAGRLFFGEPAGMLASEGRFIIFTSLAFLIILFIFFRRFEITLFDKDHGLSLGINTGLYQYLFKFMSIIIIFAGLQLTGIFLAGAAFILPFFGARLVVCGFRKVVIASASMGAFSLVAGTMVSGMAPFISSGPAAVIFSVILWCLFYLYSIRRKTKQMEEGFAI